MKNLFLSLSLATLSLLCGSCKKDDNNPLPVNPALTIAVGEYTLTGNVSFTTNGKTSNNAINNTSLFVMATDKPNTFYFLEKYTSKEVGYFVTLSGDQFTGDRIVDETFPDSNRWIGYRLTAGKVNGSTLTYGSETPTFSIQNLGALFNAKQPTDIVSMSSKTSFTATKK